MSRHSYSGLMRLPVWGLYDDAGVLVGTIRARTALEARNLFREGRLSGARVRRVEGEAAALHEQSRRELTRVAEDPDSPWRLADVPRDPIIALFCGSRGWTDRDVIRRDLQALPECSVVIEGGARGADRISREEATRLGLHVATVPALWQHYGTRAAGPLRNAAMLRLRPAVVYAYSLGTPGTGVMIKLAGLAGVPVLERRAEAGVS